MFNIQDPSFGKNKLLHEALLEACDNALYGAGAYAYVTSSGVNMLMRDKVFENFIDQGKYHLVVGMDDITNTSTLKTLADVQRKSRSHLQLSAFISADSGSTFHPKFSWFRAANGGIIVVGSGNMTAKGLRRNVEAFVIHEVSEERINEIEAMWNEWLRNSINSLKRITDAEAIEKAKQNSTRILSQPIRKKLKRPEKKEEFEIVIPIDEQNEMGAWSYDSNCGVLVAEIGKNRYGSGWTQSSWDRATYTDYFGVHLGEEGTYRLVMQSVLWSGQLGEIKIRPAVIKVVSSNYSIELSDSDKRQYPAEGRPIGVFVKVAERTFIYIIVFPNQEGHDKLHTLIHPHRKRADGLARYQTTVAELQETVPTLPLLYYLV